MSRLTRNIFHNLWGQGVLMLAALVAVSFVFKRLGADALGVISFVITFNGVLCAGFEMGVCNTTVREAATHLHDEPAYVHGLIRSAALFYWTLYAALALSIWWVAPALVNHWMHLKSLEPAAAVRAMRVLGTAAVLGLPCAFYSSLCRGLQRMEFNNAIDATASVLQQVGTIVAIAVGAGLFGVVGWLAASYALWTMAYVVFTATLFPARALIPGWSAAAVRRTLRFSLNMAAISALSVTHSEADKIVVSKLMSVSALGYYGVAARLARCASALTGAAAQAAFPALSELVHEDRGRAMQQYHKLQDLVCFGTVPLFAGIVFAAAPLFSLVFDRRIALELLLPLAFLSIGQYMNGTLNMPYIFSLADGKPEIARRLNFFALLGSLPFMILLVYRYGLAGAGFSWVVYHLFAYAYGLPRLCRECLEISVSSWLLHVGSAIALASACYGSAWATVAIEGRLGTVPLAIAFSAGSLAYASGAYFLIGDALRRGLAERIRSIFLLRSLPRVRQWSVSSRRR